MVGVLVSLRDVPVEMEDKVADDALLWSDGKFVCPVGDKSVQLVVQLETALALVATREQ